MHAQDMIKLNNEKRKELNEENLRHYEDMLVYTRSKWQLSERQLEEVLLELLDHLLIAQQEGKTAQTIFGNDLQAYCDEIISELPKEDTKSTILFLTYIGMNTLSVFLLSYGGLAYILALFNVGEPVVNFSIGKVALLIVILALTLTVVIRLLFGMMRGDAFQDENSNSYLKEAIKVGGLASLFFIPFFVGIFYIPSFGFTVTVPSYYLIIIGAIIYIGTFILNKKYRITK